MFEFNADDLKANQRGELSPRQKEWFKDISFSWTSAIIIVGFISFVLEISIHLYLQNENTRVVLLSNRMNMLIFFAVILAILGIIGLSVALAYRNPKRLENITLLSVVGDICFDKSYSSKNNKFSYYIYVGQKRFTVAKDMSRVIIKGNTYKFYYCKARQYEFVLSFQKISE